jgi:hypothetical protein
LRFRRGSYLRGVTNDNLAGVTIPLTADQSGEITQIIRAEETHQGGGSMALKTIFASVARNDDDRRCSICE